jgi:hypothetical protein
MASPSENNSNSGLSEIHENGKERANPRSHRKSVTVSGARLSLPQISLSPGNCRCHFQTWCKKELCIE